MINLKIAVATDDKKTISPHFGMAKYYLVYEVQDGVMVGKETREKASHDRHPEGHIMHGSRNEASIHSNMLTNVSDCEAIIARGMGRGMYSAINNLGIKPYVTSIAAADDAIQAYIGGRLDNHTERLH